MADYLLRKLHLRKEAYLDPMHGPMMNLGHRSITNKINTIIYYLNYIAAGNERKKKGCYYSV